MLRERLSVTNLSLENNLLTFRLNAPVVIRAKLKEVQTNVAIYTHALPKVHVGKLFSELKLVTDNFFIHAAAN